MIPVLVTGATGFLGGRILAMLLNSGVSALGIGRSVHCDITCDLRDSNACRALIARFPSSPLIHCAASVPKSHLAYFDENAAADSVDMVSNLLSAGLRHVVFTSSMTVYPEGIELAQEDAAAVCGNGYAFSKLESERMLMECAAVTATILRIPGLFGFPRRSGVLFNTALALARGEIPLLEDSLPQWAALHVDDAAEVCIRAVSASARCSMIINAGYSERMAISDAVTRLAALFGRKLTLPEPRWFAFELSRLNKVLGPVRGEFGTRLRELAVWARTEVARDRHA